MTAAPNSTPPVPPCTSQKLSLRELWNLNDDDDDAAGGAPRLDHPHRSPTKCAPPQLHLVLDRRRERDRGSDRDRERDRQRDRDRDRDRGRDRDREWERDRDRDRDDRREREKARLRSRSRSRSPVDRHRRSQSYDRTHRDSRRDRERSHDRERSREPERSRERERSRDDGDGERSRHKKRDKSHGLDGQRAAMVAEFVDGIANETQTSAPAVDDDENLMMKLGIPTGFTTTKGRYVADANHSAVKLTTKRTPRQYMNRRGGFNRPLPAESNR